jgi:glycosyltransferase involved in cell wall biosynthesis
MKILYLHSKYRSTVPSGENEVVQYDVDSLVNMGVDLEYSSFRSDDFLSQSKFRQYCLLLSLLLSWYPPTSVRKSIVENDPDLVHVHNTFPLVGYQIFKFLNKRGIQVVLTIHNTRLTCLSSSHFRSGLSCFKCSDQKGYMWGVIYGCFQNSRMNSLYLSIYNRRILSSLKYVNHFIVLNEYSRDLLIRNGIASSSVTTRIRTAKNTWNENPAKSKKVLYAGRLSREKGVDLLLDSWTISKISQQGWTLVVAGTGDLQTLVLEAAQSDPSIKFSGFLPHELLVRELLDCSILCVPSRGFEGFPTIIVEAAQFGISVVTSKVGPLAELTQSWVVAKDADAQAFSEELVRQSKMDLSSQFLKSREWHEQRLLESKSNRDLLGIYKKLVGT